MSNVRSRLTLLLLIGIVVLAAYFRLHRIEETPGWYSDEGTHLAIARQVTAGHVQYFAIADSFLLFGRPPLFELVLSAAVSVYGLSMSTLRALTGIIGTSTVVLLYFVVRMLHGQRLGLLAAFLLAIYPQAVLYSRFGFSYNLLAPLVLMTLLGLSRYHQIGSYRWLLLAALSIGIGLTGDVFAGVLILPLLIVIGYRIYHLTHHRPVTRLRVGAQSVAASLLLIAAPLSLYIVWALLNTPDAFWFDLYYTITRLSGKALLDQFSDLAFNYTVLLTQDFWLLAGLAGLFLLRQPVAILLLILPIVQLGRTVALHNLSAYYMIPLLPLVALGAAQFLGQAVAVLDRQIRPVGGRWLAVGLVIALLVVPFATLVTITAGQVNGYYPTSIDPFLLDPAASRQITAYINENAQPEDHIIASPAIGWMFDANVADFQMAVAVDGVATPHLPANIPANRWAFDPHYERARYVVIDNLWRNWGVLHNPPVEAIVDAVEAEWSLVSESGAIQVYENPN